MQLSVNEKLCGSKAKYDKLFYVNSGLPSFICVIFGLNGDMILLSDPGVRGGGTGRRPLTEPYHLRNFKKGISMPFQLDLVFIRMLLITDFVYQTGMKLRYRGKTAFSVVRIEPCATPNRTFARLDCLSLICANYREPKKTCLGQSNCIYLTYDNRVVDRIECLRKVRKGDEC